MRGTSAIEFGNKGFSDASCLSPSMGNLMKKKLLATASVALVGGIHLGNALAADAGAEEGTLQEIVVTAEKRNSTVQDTAISITAISGDELLKKGIQTVEQLIGV